MCSSPLALIITYGVYVFIKINHFDSIAEMKFDKEIRKAIKKYEALSELETNSDAENSHYLRMKHKFIKMQSEQVLKKIEGIKIDSLESKPAAVIDVIAAVSAEKKKK